MRGQALAAVWCGGCHQLPDPSLLSKDVWQHKVLPYMGLRLGFHSPEADSLVAEDVRSDTTLYPTHKLIADRDWEDIVQYYITQAPDSMLPQPKHELPQENAALFEPHFVQVANKKPAVCFVKIDTLQQPHQIVVADAFNNIFRLNNKYEVLDFLKMQAPVVDMNQAGTGKMYTIIGAIDPATKKYGSTGTFSTGADGRPAFTVLFDSLLRPVQTLAADLDNDGRTDYIICEFGADKGALSWMENKGTNHYQKHILIGLPGAIKTVVTDADKDGLPDMYVLMAQGDESIWLLTNKGNGTFRKERVLRFPPVYGSVNFELADFNKDGYPDILYTCGDNADVSPVLKPYHGIYIFMNDRTNHFLQSYFYPMYGCYNAKSADFDGDGELDIAAISFFADYTHSPQDGFVYLKNTGNNRFSPCFIPETTKGRWLCMDVNDIDGDEKPDIVLGNMAAPVTGVANENRWAQAAPLLVLKNRMK